MILRRIIVVFIFLLAGTQSNAQRKISDIDIQWSEEEVVSKKLTLSDVVGNDQTGFYTLKELQKVNWSIGPFSTNRSSSFIIEHYDQGLNKTLTSEIDLKAFGDKRSLEEVIQLKNNLYLFTSYDNKKTKQNELYIQPINTKSLTINNDAKKISEIDFEGHRKKNSGTYGHRVSRDSSKLLIYRLLPYDKKESEEFGFQVFDHEMNFLWEKEVTLPYTDELFDVESMKVDNEGNVYLLGLIYKDKRKEKRKGKPNYSYTIISYKNKGSDVKQYPVSLSEKFITDMQIAIDDNGNIICGGFYSNEGTYNIMGTYYMTINSETKAVTSQSLKEFELDFLVQNFTERQEKRTRKKADKGEDISLYSYSLEDLILKEEGGAVLVAEQYYVRTYTYSYSSANGGFHTRTSTSYYYNDIIVVNINENGAINWASKIPKSQRTTDDGGYYSSYTMAVVKDKLYFVFNDNPKNLVIEKAEKVKSFTGNKDALAVLVEVDSDGNQRKKALFSARDSGSIARPKVCRQISKDEMIIFCERKRKHRFAKISLEDKVSVRR